MTDRKDKKWNMADGESARVNHDRYNTSGAPFKVRVPLQPRADNRVAAHNAEIYMTKEQLQDLVAQARQVLGRVELEEAVGDQLEAHEHKEMNEMIEAERRRLAAEKGIDLGDDDDADTDKGEA
jgi:hypothetical protein